MPKQWVMVENNRPNHRRRLSDTATEIITEGSGEPSLTNSSVVPNAGIPSRNQNIVVLNDDSDDEDNQSRGSDYITQDSLANRSTHSSDEYYDSGHEKACRAYIRKEDAMLRVANVSVEL